MKGITLAQLKATGLPMKIGPRPSPKGKPRRTPGTMNRLEAKYATLLDERKGKGEVADWWFEAVAFRIGERCFWHPDFLVMLADGTLEIHDTKGFVQDDATVKARAVAAKFPFVVYHCTWSKKGGWKWKQM
jgi:hypothetical protein